MKSIERLKRLGYSCYLRTSAVGTASVWMVGTTYANLLLELQRGDYIVGGASANDTEPIIRVYG